MRAVIAICVLAAGCGASKNGFPIGGDASASSDAPIGCQVGFDFSPPAIPSPHAGASAHERVTADLTNLPGVATCFWTVNLGSTPVTTTALGSGCTIDFDIPTAGEYDVNVQVNSETFGGTCNGAQALDVVDDGAQVETYQVRVTPPATTIPAIEQDVQVIGGVNPQQINIAYPQLAQITGTVIYNSAPVVAYVRVAPPGSAAYVEAFTDGSGSFGPLSMLTGAEEVLIVPLVPGPSPQLFHWDTSMATLFALGDGSTISGTVTTGSGAGLAGAKVQLLLGGRQPSTIGTTGANGAFTVQTDTTDPNLIASVAVSVTPPATSGLPRLAATGAYDLMSDLTIHYAAQTTRDLGSVPVKQGATSIAGATIAVVGPIGTAGTAGAVDGDATTTATLLVAGATDATGKITGSTPVPAAPVSVVVTFASGEIEVASVDLTTGVPASIALPAQATASGTVTDSAGSPLAGVRVELVPSGALALAGAPTVEAITNQAGAYAAKLASAGTYDVRVVDPAGRGPLFSATGRSPAQIGDFALAAGLRVDGVVTLPDLSVLANASVQFTCAGCGLRPVAESSTDITGNYQVGVPDPNVD